MHRLQARSKVLLNRQAETRPVGSVSNSIIMPIQVLFFGATSAITGKRQIDVDLPEGATAGEVFEQLLAEYPLLAFLICII